MNAEVLTILESKDVSREIGGTLGAFGIPRYQTLANYASLEDRMRRRVEKTSGPPRTTALKKWCSCLVSSRRCQHAVAACH